MNAPPIAWTIAGTDPSGGAGIQADLKVFHALGVYGGSVITALIAQNTLGVMRIEWTSPEMVTDQLEALRVDLPPRAVKIGMLGTAHAVFETARILADLPAYVVADPVLTSTGGVSFLDARGERAFLDHLLPRIDLLTPNLPESFRLSGLPPDPETDPDVLIAALRNRGARAVLLKGGHAAGDQSTDILDDGVSRLYLSSPRQNVRHTHGTGCVLSSAIAAFVARGRSVEESVELAKAYINQGLRHGGGIGRGRGPLAFLGWPDNPEDRPQMIRVRDGQT